MLQFILGKSGTGKTTHIYDKITELVNNGNENIVMLVPDQSSFETEKAFFEILGAKKSKNVKVFGFSRLCRYVFEQTSNLPNNVIDNGTRAVIMNIALEQLTEKLNLLKTTNTKSLTEIMLQTLSDCKKNNISTDMLYNASQRVSDDTLKSKLYETALVLDTFDAIVSQSYIDPLDDLTRLYNILLENNLFKNYTLFVDSFSGFTSQQLMVLRLLMSQCSLTCVALTLDPLTDGREDVFATSHATYKTLKNIAKIDFIDIKSPIKLTECRRFKSNDLSELESCIFRNNSEPGENIPKNITLYSATDTYEECEFVARQIKRLVIDNNCLYSDISVICHDTEPYNGILNVIFDKYDIPYFMDSHKDIEVKPVIRLVNSLFRLILDNFEREDVLSVLKTGLTVNTSEEISVFENYIYVWNINNSAFKTEFKQNPRGFSEKFSESDTTNLIIAETVRKSIVEPVLKFKENIKNKNGREITALLYELLSEMQIQESLNKMYDVLENREENGLGAEQIRIWNLLMEAFDKTVAIIGDTNLSAKRYYELLSIQISAIELSQIPQTLDSVTVTTAQRVRISKQKISFLIGCIDGVFPAVPHCSGVFSSFELKILSLNEIKLSEDFSDLADLETFMAYCCMTSPSEQLFATYPMADLLGTPYSPSVIFEEIKKTFPQIILYDKADFDSHKDSMYAVQPAFEEYAKSLSENSEELYGLRDYFENDSYYYSKSTAVTRSLDKSPFKIENPENAQLLFGDNLRISASQIEKFNLCRFSYFCNYGLNIRERRRAEINPMEYGTLVHYILEKFFKNYEKSDYSSMNDEEMLGFVNSALNNYIEEYFGGSDTKTKSFLYKLSVLSQNVFVLLKHIVDELSQSDFYVSDCELKIGKDISSYTIKLPTGQNIAICGYVDRVDIMDSDGVKYLRIIDYKTGSKKFKLSDILYGLNLQMLLYLYSIKLNGNEKYGDILPAGILYMPATVPLISADDTFTEDKIKNEVDKNLKMNGLLLDDVKVIKGMDKTESGKYIPASIKLDTAVSDRSIASIEEFGKIFKKLDMTVMNMGKELFQGKIDASPAKGAHDACEYCPYDSVCTYRMSEPKNTFDVKNEEVYQKIDEELSKGGEE